MIHSNHSKEQSPLSIGEQFRHAREALGLSLEDVSQKIFLRPSILQQIENDQFAQSKLPSTFIKGYLRSYAKFLKLPDSLWDDVALVGEAKNDLGKTAKASKKANQYSSQSRWVGKLSILVLIIVSAMTGLWWWESYQKSNIERDNLVQIYNESQTEKENSVLASGVVQQATTDSSAQETIAPNVTVITNSENNIPETQSEVVVSDLAQTSLTPAETAEPEELSTAPTLMTQSEPVVAPKTVPAVELYIEVLGDCWISVKDLNGKILAQKQYKQGESLSFNQGSPYDLIIGAPSAVNITYKGAAYPLKVDGRVAKFKLQ